VERGVPLRVLWQITGMSMGALSCYGSTLLFAPEPVRWAREELNLPPLPCQQTTGEPLCSAPFLQVDSDRRGQS
jgi:hypothetical protein